MNNVEEVDQFHLMLVLLISVFLISLVFFPVITFLVVCIALPVVMIHMMIKHEVKDLCNSIDKHHI